MLRLLATLVLAQCLFAAQARAETYRLNYEAAVLGVVVLGTASYEVAASGQRYAIRGNVRTSGLARLFDQTQITATTSGTLSGNTIAWSRYDLSHAYANKFRRIAMTNTGGAVTAQVQPAFASQGQPPASAAQRASAYDPLSAIFALGRQIGGARACNGAVLVFDGRQLYRLSVTPHAQANFGGGGYNGPALNCQFHYQPIAGFTRTPRQIPTADAWFALPAQPGFAAPLRMTVPTPLGAAQLDIRGYQQVAG